MFSIGGAGGGKSFLIQAKAEYLKRVLRCPNQNVDQPSVLVTASTGKLLQLSVLLYCILHFISLLSQN